MSFILNYDIAPMQLWLCDNDDDDDDDDALLLRTTTLSGVQRGSRLKVFYEISRLRLFTNE
jgi:hypothetical protein